MQIKPPLLQGQPRETVLYRFSSNLYQDLRHLIFDHSIVVAQALTPVGGRKCLVCKLPFYETETVLKALKQGLSLHHPQAKIDSAELNCGKSSPGALTSIPLEIGTLGPHFDESPVVQSLSFNRVAV